MNAGLRRCSAPFVLLAASLAYAAELAAQVAPEKDPAVAEKAFRHADLDIAAAHLEVRQLPAAATAQARGRLNRLGVAESSAFVDPRGGRFVTLMPATPLLPGRGAGNRIAWSDLRIAEPRDAAAAEKAAYAAFEAYLRAHRHDLGIDPAELGYHQVAGHGFARGIAGGGADLYQIFVQRQFGGIPVRGSVLTATIGQGNLTLMGVELWGERPEPFAGDARLSAAEARRLAEDFWAPVRVAREWGKTELWWIPVARGRDPLAVPLGKGYGYRLAWSVKLNVEGDGGNWETLVDARSGEILANEDKNVYAEAKGGVYPLSNDGANPDGIEQAGWPMPFLALTGGTTDTGGNANVSGSLTASLSGTYVSMNDNCGAISLTQSGNLDFGSSAGTDCTTPGFGGAGNTHASRSGFYELNKLMEMARGQLPGNGWLSQQLTANMNINLTCNAFWNGSTVNFYRSGGGCFNTGEIAAIFDHEWGHGLDDNDVNGTIASPSGEGIADIYAALRLDDSCIGRGFTAGVCNNDGDACTTCTGVRDIDYLKRVSGQPHDYSWSNANCGGVHCVGGVYAEAVWSLWKRKLAAAPYSLDANTAHEVVTRLSYLAGTQVTAWFSGGPPNGGCAAGSGYLNFLAADDDNGNLNDGTPHMGAVHAAFADQEIACGSPTVQDSGCAGNPAAAPNVTATAGDKTVGLAWAGVAGAAKYQVFRTEGVALCAYGKVKLGETTALGWSDPGLQNGRDYSYVVIPIGAGGASCLGPASACDTAQPAAAPPPDFSVACSPAGLTLQQGAGGNATCTVTAIDGYGGQVGLACAGQPAGISCSFSPDLVSPTAASTLTVAVTAAQATGTYDFDVVAEDGTLTRTADFSVQVTAAPLCAVHADCDDGLFCNGAETCSGGACRGGSYPCGVGQACDEGTDSCSTAPVTVALIASGASNGWVRESGENSNAGGLVGDTPPDVVEAALRVGDHSADQQLKAFVNFDTAGIPDGATVTAATLRLRRGSVTGSNPFATHGTCYVDIRNPFFGTTLALAAGDFQAAATATQVGSLSNAAANLDWSSATLDAAGVAAVNKTGKTQFRVYFSLDDNDDNDADYLGYYGVSPATPLANRPQLVITYLP